MNRYDQFLKFMWLKKVLFFDPVTIKNFSQYKGSWLKRCYVHSIHFVATIFY